MLPADEAIPIGRYGTSNVGRAKTVYRMGLSYRYGRRMQTISGIHYNFSLPGVGSDGYFALIRNFRGDSGTAESGVMIDRLGSILFVAAIAALGPAWRAARVDWPGSGQR